VSVYIKHISQQDNRKNPLECFSSNSLTAIRDVWTDNPKGLKKEEKSGLKTKICGSLFPFLGRKICFF
jgi:hypothetical protein